MKTFALTGLDLHEYVSGFVRIWPPDLSGCSGHIIFLFIWQSLDRYRHTLDFPPNFSKHLLQIDTLNIPNEPITEKSCRKAETFCALIKNIYAFVSSKATNPAYIRQDFQDRRCSSSRNSLRGMTRPSHPSIHLTKLQQKALKAHYIPCILLSLAVKQNSAFTDMKFVQNFTVPDFQVKNFTPSISISTVLLRKNTKNQ